MTDERAELEKRTRHLEVTARAAAAKAAIEQLSGALREYIEGGAPYSRSDNPSLVLYGTIYDLLDGCYEAGFVAGQDSGGAKSE